MEIESQLNKYNIMYKKEEQLSRHSTILIGGKTPLFIMPKTEKEVVIVLNLLSKYKIKYVVVSGGSNMLFPDSEIDFCVISTERLNEITENETTIKLGAGVSMGIAIAKTEERNLQGLENFVGVPCKIGGAVKGNLGCNGVEIKDYIFSVEIATLNGIEKRVVKKEDFSYRKSNIQGIITGAEFILRKSDREKIHENLLTVFEKRKRTQPLTAATLGCIFKNPKGLSAGALIEGGNMKGIRVGDIMVSKRHANFFENVCKGRQKDAINLIDIIKENVYNKYRVNLETEIEIVNC